MSLNRTSRLDSGFPQGKDAEPLKSYARKAQRRSVRVKRRVERGCAPLARFGPASPRSTFCSLLFAFLSLLVATVPLSTVRADIALPVGDARDTIQIQAEEGQRWRLGEYEVWLLPRGLSVQQGQVVARAKQAVLWIHRREGEGADPLNVTLTPIFSDGSFLMLIYNFAPGVEEGSGHHATLPRLYQVRLPN